jgi:hypothetical protein
MGRSTGADNRRAVRETKSRMFRSSLALKFTHMGSRRIALERGCERSIGRLDLVPNDSRLPLLRRMRTWLAILGAGSSRSGHEWTAGKGSNVAERNVRHIAGFTF